MADEAKEPRKEDMGKARRRSPLYEKAESSSEKKDKGTGTNERDLDKSPAKKPAEKETVAKLAGPETRHKSERVEMHKRQEGERRNLHGAQRDEHRTMHERQEKEHDAGGSEGAHGVVKMHRKHEHEKSQMQSRHQEAHAALHHKHMKEGHEMADRQEAELMTNPSAGQVPPAGAMPATPQPTAPAPAVPQVPQAPGV
jgi:hypothetical protein